MTCESEKAKMIKADNNQSKKMMTVKESGDFALWLVLAAYR